VTCSEELYRLTFSLLKDLRDVSDENMTKAPNKPTKRVK